MWLAVLLSNAVYQILVRPVDRHHAWSSLIDQSRWYGGTGRLVALVTSTHSRLRLVAGTLGHL